jgi:hypothetical protein
MFEIAFNGDSFTTGEEITVVEYGNSKQFKVKSITPVINTHSPWNPKRLRIELEEVTCY